MTVFEVVGNFHMHTPYSDGEAYHAEIAEAALRAGLDVVLVTDHNVWVDGPARYYAHDARRVLLLVGEEVHDQTRQPQKNHLLVYGAEKELARHAAQPQGLLNAAADAGALTFLAHPVDPPAPLVGESDLSWVSWEVTGFTGIELWNYMTSFKALLTSRPTALRYAYNPELGMTAPFPDALALWDRLTTAGRRIVAIGNADAHGTEYRMGGLRRVIFPYEFLFKQVNTHILSETAPTGDYAHDRGLVLDALAAGHCFVAYDAAGPTRGFRFSATHERGSALMGDNVNNRNGATLQISSPLPASLRLLRNGAEVGRWDNQTNSLVQVPAGEVGVYRVEAHRMYSGRLRGWVYTNPLYLHL
ncbi:MAG: PHP domain-containing protein [Anaerolineales bacterium]|nr:PHP domain-containing protein [Anaerolineales bacterium]